MSWSLSSTERDLWLTLVARARVAANNPQRTCAFLIGTVERTDQARAPEGHHERGQAFDRLRQFSRGYAASDLLHRKANAAALIRHAAEVSRILGVEEADPTPRSEPFPEAAAAWMGRADLQ